MALLKNKNYHPRRRRRGKNEDSKKAKKGGGDKAKGRQYRWGEALSGDAGRRGREGGRGESSGGKRSGENMAPGVIALKRVRFDT